MQCLPQRPGVQVPSGESLLGRQDGQLTLEPVDRAMRCNASSATALLPPSRNSSSNLRLACATHPAGNLHAFSRASCKVMFSILASLT